jgi:hypothetical protein
VWSSFSKIYCSLWTAVFATLRVSVLNLYLDADCELSVVSGPRNHFYRTPLDSRSKVLRSRGELDHVRNLANEFDLETAFSRAELDALDEVPDQVECFCP